MTDVLIAKARLISAARRDDLMEMLTNKDCKMCQNHKDLYSVSKWLVLSVFIAFLWMMAITLILDLFHFNWQPQYISALFFSSLVVIRLVFSDEAWGRDRYVFVGEGGVHLHRRNPEEDFSLKWIEEQNDLSVMGMPPENKIYFRFREGGYLFHPLYRLIHWKTPYNRVYVYECGEDDISRWKLSTWRILAKSRSNGIYLKGRPFLRPFEKDADKGTIGPISIVNAMQIMTQSDGINKYLSAVDFKDKIRRRSYYNNLVKLAALQRCVSGPRRRGPVIEELNILVSYILKKENVSLQEKDIAETVKWFQALLKPKQPAKEENVEIS